MIAFDTSFLVDYLDGERAAAEYLETHREKPFFAPSLALFAVYRGAARVGGADEVARAESALDWLEPLSLTAPAVREAALIEAELLESGEPVNLGDTLIGGICRHNGARIVTRDSDFDRIEDLEVIPY